MKIPVRVPNNIKAKTENPIPIPIQIPRSMGSNRSCSSPEKDKKGKSLMWEGQKGKKK